MTDTPEREMLKRVHEAIVSKIKLLLVGFEGATYEVVHAMREPTEAMKRAGVETGVIDFHFMFGEEHCAKIWRAMIDELLREPPPPHGLAIQVNAQETSEIAPEG